jgi:Winged helix DNA-binding domain
MRGLEIARLRMRNSRLTGSSFDAPDEVVRWHGAMQAQDYGPAKWAVGQRAENLVDKDLDEAVATGSIVRTHVLRPTWHFVARDDIRWLLALTAPRVHQHNAPRYRDLGLDAETRARCEGVIVSALEGASRLTRDGIGTALENAGIDTSGQRLPYVLMHCELEAAICSGGREGKQHAYALVDERVPEQESFDRDDALTELVRRYLRSHGPATVKDLRWWSSLTVSDIKKALSLLGDEVQHETSEGLTFWSTPLDEAPGPKGPAVHLLQPYDEFVIGYSESRYFGDPRADVAREAWRDRSLPNGVILVNGGFAGHWRRTIGKDLIEVEALVYQDLESVDAEVLEDAASRLGRFIGREVSLEMRTL